MAGVTEGVRRRPDAGPLRLVLAAVRDGARVRDDIARRTGLGPDVVGAAVDHLVRTGLVDRPAPASGCPATACGNCAIGCARRG